MVNTLKKKFLSLLIIAMVMLGCYSQQTEPETNINENQNEPSNASQEDEKVINATSNENEEELDENEFKKFFSELNLQPEQEITREEFRGYFMQLMDKSVKPSAEERSFYELISEELSKEFPEKLQVKNMGDYLSQDRIFGAIQKVMTEKMGINFPTGADEGEEHEEEGGADVDDHEHHEGHEHEHHEGHEHEHEGHEHHEGHGHHESHEHHEGHEGHEHHHEKTEVKEDL